MKHHHSHLPDPFKVSSVSKIFEEWSTDSKYRFPHIDTEGYEKHFSPKEEIENLRSLLNEKDSHFFQKAYKSYLKYITAHEKGVLVQNQDALKALSCFRQMILSRASSQRFNLLFEKLEKVQTTGTRKKKKRSNESKHRLPKVPTTEVILTPKLNKIGEVEELKEEIKKPEELPQKRKHKHYHREEKKSGASNKTSSVKDENQVSIHEDNGEIRSQFQQKQTNKEDEDIDSDIDIDMEEPEKKPRRNLDSGDEEALISPLVESSSAVSNENSDLDIIQSSKSIESKKSYSISDKQHTDSEQQNLEECEDKRRDVNSFDETTTIEDSQNPLQEFIALLKRQNNGLINDDILHEIYEQLEIYRPFLEDSCKANIPILEEYKCQIEAGFFPIESIQNLVFMLKSISSKV